MNRCAAVCFRGLAVPLAVIRTCGFMVRQVQLHAVAESVPVKGPADFREPPPRGIKALFIPRCFPRECRSGIARSCCHLRRTLGLLNQIIGCLLSFRCGRKDRPLIGLQNLEPRCDVLGMIGRGSELKPKVRQVKAPPSSAISSSTA